MRGIRGYVFWAFIAIAAYFLLTEHRAHVVPYLPLLLIAACPLLHMFHNHGGHEGHGDRPADPARQPDNPKPTHSH